MHILKGICTKKVKLFRILLEFFQATNIKSSFFISRMRWKKSSKHFVIQVEGKCFSNDFHHGHFHGDNFARVSQFFTTTSSEVVFESKIICFFFGSKKVGPKISEATGSDVKRRVEKAFAMLEHSTGSKNSQFSAVKLFIVFHEIVVRDRHSTFRDWTIDGFVKAFLQMVFHFRIVEKFFASVGFIFAELGEILPHLLRQCLSVQWHPYDFAICQIGSFADFFNFFGTFLAVAMWIRMITLIQFFNWLRHWIDKDFAFEATEIFLPKQNLFFLKLIFGFLDGIWIHFYLQFIT